MHGGSPSETHDVQCSTHEGSLVNAEQEVRFSVSSATSWPSEAGSSNISRQPLRFNVLSSVSWPSDSGSFFKELHLQSPTKNYNGDLAEEFPNVFFTLDRKQTFSLWTESNKLSAKNRTQGMNVS